MSFEPDIIGQQQRISTVMEERAKKYRSAEIGEPSDGWSYEEAWDKKIMGSVDKVKPKELVEYELKSKKTSYSPSLPERLVEKVKAGARRIRDYKNRIGIKKGRETEEDVAKIIIGYQRKKKAKEQKKDAYLEMMEQVTSSNETDVSCFIDRVLVEGDLMAYMDKNGNVFSKAGNRKEITGIDKNGTVYEFKWSTLEGKPVIKGKVLGKFKGNKLIEYRDREQHKFVIGTIENTPVVFDEKTLAEFKRKSILPA